MADTMDDSEERSDGISVEPVGWQNGESRFQRREDRPAVAQWRMNLTALSQFQNLYFVAYVDKIFVYEPRFPEQKVSHKPALILKPPVSKQGLRGFIDQRNPHAINYLLVDELGDEEVLACACDDGDVIVYLVRTVHQAVQRRVRDEGFYSVEADEVKPCFTHHVEMSAWGLAFHKASRTMAISSNTTFIDVIRFALSSNRADSSSEEDDASPAIRPKHVDSDVVDARDVQAHLRLVGHGTNIPCVAFCNNIYDTKGDWLLSTDINGVTKIWDLRDKHVVSEWRFGTPPPKRLESNWELQRGWSVLCLDRTSFKTTHGLGPTFGCKARGEKGQHDISMSIHHLIDRSTRYPSFYSLYSVDRQRPSSNFSEQSQPESTMYEDYDDDSNELAYDDYYYDGQDEDMLAGDDYNSEGHFDEDGVGDIEEDEDGEESDLDAEDDNPFANISEEDEDAGLSDITMEEVSEAEDHGLPISGIEERKQNELSAPCHQTLPGRAPPRFPILHTSEINVRLLSNLYNGARTICRNVLAQQPPPYGMSLGNFERLNMVMQIPELSMVAVGCQTGRVALFTLTRDAEQPEATMRLEAIVPFRRQEEAGMRPVQPLLGMALGPIQGRERTLEADITKLTTSMKRRKELWRKKEKVRRYRLMLMYYDHTVLSYEIGREQGIVNRYSDYDMEFDNERGSE